MPTTPSFGTELCAAKIIHLPITQLRPQARNARTHSRKQLKQIAQSIERFGFTNPVLINEEQAILAGHGRVEAARMLGWTTKTSTPGASFAANLAGFLEAYSNARSGTFTTSGPLAAAMRELKDWLEKCAPIAARPTIKVKISVGQGGWTKTPWIALLDDRVTTSTQRGIYIVFLVAEDLSVTHLTLNQGMTDLVARLGQRGAVEEMKNVAQAARPRIANIVAGQFQLDNAISLHSETSAAKNYEVGTIAHAPIMSDAIPDDDQVIESLEVLLQAYDRLIDESAHPLRPRRSRGSWSSGRT